MPITNGSSKVYPLSLIKYSDILDGVEYVHIVQYMRENVHIYIHVDTLCLCTIFIQNSFYIHICTYIKYICTSIRYYCSVLRIRISFLSAFSGLLDPDPYSEYGSRSGSRYLKKFTQKTT